MVKLRANAVSERRRLFPWQIYFRAKIVDVEEDSLMIELTGTQSKLEAFLNLAEQITRFWNLQGQGITGLSTRQQRRGVSLETG